MTSVSILSIRVLTPVGLRLGGAALGWTTESAIVFYRINNSQARRYVAARAPFKGSNLFGGKINDLYVVHSYGPHWPLFVYDTTTGIWYENMDKRSGTTSRHKTQAHPQCQTVLMSHEEIVEFVRG